MTDRVLSFIHHQPTCNRTLTGSRIERAVTFLCGFQAATANLFGAAQQHPPDKTAHSSASVFLLFSLN